MAKSAAEIPFAAAELVRRRVDIILASGTPSVLPAKEAAGQIPVVFVGTFDPVATGLIASLAKPGGNITGATSISGESLLRIVRSRTTCMSDNRAKRTYAGFWFNVRRTGIFTLCVVLAPQIAASYGVRLSAIPEAYWGTWVPTAEICQDANKSGIVLWAKAYVTSAVSCAVNYVAETPSSKGPIYSARLQCSNKAGQSPKKVANLGRALNARERAFVREAAGRGLTGVSLKHAYIRAGYSPKSASGPRRLLNNPRVRHEIEQMERRKAAEAGVRLGGCSCCYGKDCIRECC